MVPDRYYGFAVGRVKALETALLDRDRLERLAAAADLQEALNQLGETEYAPHIAVGLEPMRIAPAEMARVKDLLLGMASGAPELDFLLWRWDLMNLKALLRRETGGETPALNQLGRYAPDALVRWYNGERMEMPEFFARARAAGEAAGGDPQMVDMAVDRLYYEYGTQLWAGRESFLPDYWRARIDLINLRTLVRGKLLGFDRRRLERLFIPGGAVAADRFAVLTSEPWEEIAAWWSRGRYGATALDAAGLRDLAVLEKAGDDLLLYKVRAAKMTALGLEPVLGYYLAKEHETRLVNLILAAKAARVPAERIKERLRIVYA